MRRKRAISLVIGIAGFAVGCATTSPFNQEFVEVRSPHFTLTSSLGEAATIELARNLEFFHAGVVDAIGLAGEPDAGPERSVIPPTQVFAFDDRSVERPFAVRGEPTQILSRPQGMLWIFRAGRSFDERVSTDIRHQYAHQLIRDRSPTLRPLWYEEGVAQMAGTVEEVETGVRIGRMVPEHRQLLLDWRRSTVAAKMRKSNLAQDSAPERRLFEAQSWAIAHTLRFAAGEPNAESNALDRYRRAIDEGGPGAKQKARKELGISDAALTEWVFEHLNRKRLRVRLVKVEGWEPKKLRLTKLPIAEGRVRLASLALALERPALAEEYFERALQAAPNLPAAQAGLAVVAAWEGRGKALETFASQALSRARSMSSSSTLNATEESPELYRRLGTAYHVAAHKAEVGAERNRRIQEAREALTQVLSVLPRDVDARVKLGQLELLAAEGHDAKTRFECAERATEWFEAAGVLRPGSLLIEVGKARAEQLAGLGRAAEIRLNEVISRTHFLDLEREARAILEADVSMH